MFNGAQVHLLLNHLPILGVLFSLLLLGYGAWRKNLEIQKVSAGALVLIGLLSIPAFKSGEAAEEIVEDRAGISEVLIHNHEEAAELAFWALEAFAIAALIGLVYFRTPRTWPAWFSAVLITGMLVIGGLMARAGHLGGLISHPEIRNASQQMETLPLPEREDRDNEH